MIGTVVIGGMRFPVERVSLERASVVFHFTVRGPFSGSTGPITLFGSDGQGIAQGKTWVLPVLAEGITWECLWHLEITKMLDTGVFAP